jgi:hypothetical protein
MSECARCGKTAETNGVIQAIVPGFSATYARPCPDCSLSLALWSKPAAEQAETRGAP